jgi:hypothetical protein
MELMLNEAKKHNSSAVVQFSEANKRILTSQKDIKESIKSTSEKTQLDTTRLLRICMGLATGVKRMDDRHARFQQQAKCQNQQLIRAQLKTERSLVEISKSMKHYAMRSSVILNQMLHT